MLGGALQPLTEAEIEAGRLATAKLGHGLPDLESRDNGNGPVSLDLPPVLSAAAGPAPPASPASAPSSSSYVPDLGITHLACVRFFDRVDRRLLATTTTTTTMRSARPGKSAPPPRPPHHCARAHPSSCRRHPRLPPRTAAAPEVWRLALAHDRVDRRVDGPRVRSDARCARLFFLPSVKI